MYSIRDKMAYHGCLCPGCLWKGIQTVLYIRGSEEANNAMQEPLKKLYEYEELESKKQNEKSCFE